MTPRPGVDVGWLDAVLAWAGRPPSIAVSALGGGTYNTVLRVATGVDDVVVKVAPDPARPALTYEYGIMATEAQYYRLAATHGLTSVPRVLNHGVVDGVEVLVLSLCPGRPWPEVDGRLDDAERHAVRAAVGREVAALHRITGPGYGYPARPLAATWRDAFTAMVGAVLDDAGRYGVRLPRAPEQIAAIVDRVSPALDEVQSPALIHFDLWDGNILVDANAIGGPRLGGLIDAERAFWGDPAAELVSLRLFSADLEPDEGLRAGYEGAGGRLVLDQSARLRLTLYRIYLYLIMWVEAVPRQSGPGRVSWLREAVLRPTADMLDELARA